MHSASMKSFEWECWCLTKCWPLLSNFFMHNFDKWWILSLSTRHHHHHYHLRYHNHHHDQSWLIILYHCRRHHRPLGAGVRSIPWIFWWKKQDKNKTPNDCIVYWKAVILMWGSLFCFSAGFSAENSSTPAQKWEWLSEDPTPHTHTHTHTHTRARFFWCQQHPQSRNHCPCRCLLNHAFTEDYNIILYSAWQKK